MPRKPRPASGGIGGVEGHPAKGGKRKLPYREAPACGRGASYIPTNDQLCTAFYTWRFRMNLNDNQIERYSRQILLPQVGGRGQEKLLAAKVLVIGAGGLGSPVASYLAGAGVGILGIVDSDTVDLSNLHRQMIYSSEDIGKKKAIAAQARLQSVNPDVKVVPHVLRLNSENIMEVIKDYDIVVDGTDNFPTRYLVNDACVLAGKTLVFGAFFRFEGQAMVVKPGEGPCLRCIFPEPPPPGLVPSCQEAGVLGALAGVIGLIQATETLKLILGIGEPIVGKLVLFNALGMDLTKMNTRRDEDCPICSARPKIRELVDYEQFCGLKASPPPAF